MQFRFLTLEFKVLLGMKDIQDYQQDIASIRSVMERSVKFLSLSGFSGILAGVYALIGAFAAYYIIYYPNTPFGFRSYYADEQSTVIKLIFIAVTVLLLSLITGYAFSVRKAKKAGTSVWTKPSKQFLVNLFIPLVTGGLLIMILVYRGYFGIVAPSCLIFYGLALIYASQHTFREIRYLGFSEIALGLVSALLPGYGLVIWALGFGVLHIVYGSLMYYRYDQ
jgi:hypothetical protein